MKKEKIKIKEMYDLTHTIAADYLSGFEYPWEALQGISDFLMETGKKLSKEKYEKRGENVWIHKTAKIAPTAFLNGPLIVCKDAEIRHCAFIRGIALVGEGAVVGNSTELKNVILFDKVQVPHYNYVGDSILGYKAHMGAGSITSNVKSDKLLVNIHAEDGEIATGRKKVGALIGDNVEVGCNSVLNPGTVIGRESSVYPLSSVRGCIDAGSIYKRLGEITQKLEIEKS